MSEFKVRNVIIGEGRPKICVPIVGKKQEEILSQAHELPDSSADMVEWRADWYEDIFCPDTVCALLEELRYILGNTPLLFTFRTVLEGGVRQCEERDYKELNRIAIASGYIDLVDLELARGLRGVEELVLYASTNGVVVVGSNHDFEKTPPKDEILKRLLSMKAAGAQIAKIAVMPQSPQDVLTLLEATLKAKEAMPDTPVISMSMSPLGAVSRICGQVFGSAVTFGSAGQTSAPGQIQMDDLRKILNILDLNS